MIFENFVESISKSLEEAHGVSLSIRQVDKINEPQKRAVIMKDIAQKNNQRLGLSLYLDELFQDYSTGKLTMDDAKKIVFKVYEKAEKEDSVKVAPMLDLHDTLSDFENIKDKLFCIVISSLKNEILLSKVPHINYLDLSVIFRIEISSTDEGVSTITVTQELLEHWDISVDELYECALANTKSKMPIEVEYMDTFLEILTGIPSPLPTKALPLLVATNHNRTWGANAILDEQLLDEVADKLDSDLLIIPSSIHEIMIVSASDKFANSDSLKEIVLDCNKIINTEDYLSDSIYRYDRKSKKVSLAS